MGAYEVRIAEPRRGFEHAVPERHPLALFPECRSVVVFIVPRPAWANNTAVAVKAPGPLDAVPERLPLAQRLFHAPGWTTVSVIELLRERVWVAGANLLRARGHRVGRGYVPEKLCAYEAGIGVYGRSGLILHPALGNRISPGVFLTDAVFEPDPRAEDFHPCRNCRACQDACPAGAYRVGEPYHERWSRESCQAKRDQLAAAGIYCHECFRACPAGTAGDGELMAVRRLRSHGPNRRGAVEAGSLPTADGQSGPGSVDKDKDHFS